MRHARLHQTLVKVASLQNKSTEILKLYENLEEIQTQILAQPKKPNDGGNIDLLMECSALESKLLKDLYANYNKKFY